MADRRQNLPTVPEDQLKHCIECGKLLRPLGTLKAQYPNTTTAGARGLCVTDYERRLKNERRNGAARPRKPRRTDGKQHARGYDFEPAPTLIPQSDPRSKEQILAAGNLALGAKAYGLTAEQTVELLKMLGLWWRPGEAFDSSYLLNLPQYKL